MNKFLKELLCGFKWVLISIIILVIIVILWVGCAWSLGWLINKYFDLQNFGPRNFITFGSIVMVFTLLIQVITIIITVQVLIAWGKSRRIIKKENIK